MRLIRGEDCVVMGFVEACIWQGRRRFDGSSRAVGVVDAGGTMIGGVVFHDWQPAEGVIELSAGARRASWLSRRMAAAILAIPFREFGCQMVVARTRDDNWRARRLLTGLGFSAVRMRRLYGRALDGLLFSLTDDEWRSGPYRGGD